MEYTVQVTRIQTSRSHRVVKASSMKEAQEIIETQINNGDYNPRGWIMRPVVYEVVPLIP